jgi:CRISPR-associated Cas5-like protein
MSRIYPFSVEFSGDFGMFVRPDTGSEPFSYEIPTKSTARGMIESICWIKNALIEPIAVGICYEPSWIGYTYNSYSPYRKADLISSGNACQIRAGIVVNPRFVILGLCHSLNNQKNGNNAHSLQDQLRRRVNAKKFHNVPVMGWKDFPVNEFSTQKTSIQPRNGIIPILASVKFANGDVEFESTQNVKMENGVVNYEQYEEVVLKDKIMSDGSTIKCLTFASNTLDDMLTKFSR